MLIGSKAELFFGSVGFYWKKFVFAKTACRDINFFRIAMVVVDQVFLVLRTFRNDPIGLRSNLPLHFTALLREAVVLLLMKFSNVPERVVGNHIRDLCRFF